MRKIFLLSFIITFYTIGLAQTPNPSWLRKITLEAGLDSARGGRIWVADVNNDNYPDLFWGEGGINKNHLHLMLNVPNPDSNSEVRRIFINWTDSSGINANRDESKTGRIVDIMAAADVNSDGNIDIVTSIYYHRLQMYQNGQDPGDRTEVMLGDGKGHFALKKDAGVFDISMNDTLPKGLINATGMSYLDYDYDGNLDLYMSTWFTDYAAFNGVGTPMPDLMLKGNGDGSFTRLMNIGLEGIAEPEYGVDVTDYDNDGWQDIITSPYCRSGGVLFKNRKDGKFVNFSSFANYSAQKMQGDNGQNLCQWSAQPADFDNDGDMDLLQVQVHGGYDANEGRTHIAVNGGFKEGYSFQWDLTRIYRDAPSETHLGDQGGNWFDIDNDGWQDILIGQSAYPAANTKGQERLYVCHNDSDRVLRDISKPLGLFYSIKEAHTPIPVDFDLDGSQDILVSHTIRDTTKTDSVPYIKTWTQIELLRNYIAKSNNWAAYKLKSTSSSTNKSAIGSRIYLNSGNLNQIREIQAGVGHFAGQMPFIQNFGLSGKHYIDSVSVRWPRKDLLVTNYLYPPLNCISELSEDGKINVVKTWTGARSIIAFKNPVLKFDTVKVGKSKTLSFDIWNLGDSVLIINDIVVNSSTLSKFTLSGISFPVQIPENSSKTLSLTLEPTARLDYSTSLKVTSNAYNTPIGYVDIQAFGFEEKPIIASDSSDLDFGKVFLTKQKQLTLKVKNDGEMPLEISKLNLTENADNSFEVKTVCQPCILQPKEIKPFDIVFKPAKESNYISKLVFVSNAYNDPGHLVNLYGAGDIPRAQIKVSPTIIFMGSTPKGQTSEKEIYVYNTGNGELNITSVDVVDETMKNNYSFSDVNFPLNIQPTDSSLLLLKFSPLEEKLYNTKLQFNSNAVDEPAKQVPVKGTGTAATGVREISPQKYISLQITPNPVNSNAKVTILNNSEISFSATVEIIDVYGRKFFSNEVLSVDSGKTEKDYDLGNLSQGVYFVVLKSFGLNISVPFNLIKN